jgi:1-acyl-sn-glycerol-3-phosphate acyltransferase
MVYCPGYEVSGMENIPDDTPALIVYYHGAIPIDLFYFVAKTFLFKNRVIHTVGDRFLFKIPGKYKPTLAIMK